MGRYSLGKNARMQKAVGEWESVSELRVLKRGRELSLARQTFLVPIGWGDKKVL